MASEALRLYGTEEPVEPVRELRAGALAIELQGARLRRICCDGREVWHGLVFVLRDPDWGTPEPVVRRCDLRSADDAFAADLEGFFPSSPPVPFRLRIEGHADGRVSFEAEAVPPAGLQVNRLGLCLLHPLAACGARVQVRHVDGRLSESSFPTLIPPWPPFMLVRALRHEWAPGCWAEALLEGDHFETEDQRNNADASFKTYSRSNMAPRPYAPPAGVPLRQRALLQVQGRAPAVEAPAPQLAVGSPAGPLPAVGLAIDAADALQPALLEPLRELQPAHLHLAWRPGQPVHWSGVAAMLAAAGARLRLDVFQADDGALRELRQALDAAAVAPDSLALFPAGPAAVAAARRLFPAAAIGGGTPHFFVQLSRLDFLGPVDFASFTTASVVHGADDADVMAGLASLPAMVATWRARHPAVPLRVGPSAIAARASPLGAQPSSDGTRRLALAATDPRDRAAFGAAWALGHAAAFAGAGVQAITLLALTGPQGVLAVEGERITKRPAFDVLALLGRPAERLAVGVSDPQGLAALALRRGGETTLAVANLAPRALTIALAGAPRSVLALPPFGVTCVPG